MVSPDVVGNGSEYFVVYFRVYICSADYIGLPVLSYLLQCLVYHMLSKMGRSSGIYIYIYRSKVIGEVLVLGLLVVV